MSSIDINRFKSARFRLAAELLEHSSLPVSEIASMTGVTARSVYRWGVTAGGPHYFEERAMRLDFEDLSVTGAALDLERGGPLKIDSDGGETRVEEAGEDCVTFVELPQEKKKPEAKALAEAVSETAARRKKPEPVTAAEELPAVNYGRGYERLRYAPSARRVYEYLDKSLNQDGALPDLVSVRINCGASVSMAETAWKAFVADLYGGDMAAAVRPAAQLCSSGDFVAVRLNGMEMRWSADGSPAHRALAARVMAVIASGIAGV